MNYNWDKGDVMKKLVCLIGLAALLVSLMIGCRNPVETSGLSLIARRLSNSAVFVPEKGDLVAGQSIKVGAVTVTNDIDNLYVQYSLTDGWEMTESHLSVSLTLDGIPQTGSGNPIPGQFNHKILHDPPTAGHCYAIPLDQYGLTGGDVPYIAAHAEVQKDDAASTVVQMEGAWAAGEEGDQFVGKNWATYFQYFVATSGTALWARTVSTGAMSWFYSTAVDASEYIYAAGTIDGTGTYTFGNGITAVGVSEGINGVLAKYNSSGTALWVRTAISGGSRTSFRATTVDASGNVYVVGYIRGTSTYTFGSGVTATGTFSESNALLVKYDATGTALWARTVSTGASYSTFKSATIDSDGNVYAAGSIHGTGTYTFGVGVTAEGSFSGPNVVLVKYDSSGKALWARTVSTGASESNFNCTVVDADGNVYAAGYIGGTETYTFGSGVTATGTSSISPTYSPSLNVVLVKYNSAGTALWARSVTSGTLSSLFKSTAVGADGNIYAAGSIEGTETYSFGNGVTVTGPSSGGNVILVKYDPSGTAQLAHTVTIASPGLTKPSSMFNSTAVDPDGNVYAAGIIRGTTTYAFGNGVTATGLVSGGGSSVALVKYNSSGNALWAQTVGTGASGSVFNSAALNSGSNVYVAGVISGTETYTFYSGVTATGPSSGPNVVLVKYSK